MKATKPEEKGGRESERQIVPLKQGNLLEGTLWREGGAIVMEPLEGNLPDAGGDAGNIEARKCLNETSEGSEVV